MMGNITGRVDLDVEIMYSTGDRFQVSVGPDLRASGWRGGTWVQYSTSATEDFVIEISDGNEAAGFLSFASEDYTPGAIGGPENNWTNLQLRSTSHANVVTMWSGGLRAYFKVYETVALSGGTRSGAEIVYALHDKLYVSENGLFCNDSTVELGNAGISDPVYVGIVSAVPSARNGYRLGVDVKF